MNHFTDDQWQDVQRPVELSREAVHVFRIDLDLTPQQYQSLVGLLSPDECERADRYRFDEPRMRFVACRGALRQILGDCLNREPHEIRFQYGEHGKPELVAGQNRPGGPRWQFNVSHSRNRGLIAVGDDIQIGIDIEERNPTVKILKLAERFFAPAENEELKNLASEKQLAGFFRGWTCKEAYIKATGKGLAQSLSSFCVTINPNQPASLRTVDNQPDEPGRWTTKELHAGGNFSAAMIVGKPDCRVECWNWIASK